MATTPNYGWVMPDPTDFVTDLPADFEIFGDAVDTTLEAIETKLDVITTEGDLIVGDASGDPVRVPVGTAGQVLASDGDTVEWINPTGGGMTLIATATPSAATSVSFTSIPTTFKTLILVAEGVFMSINDRGCGVRLNNDTAINYHFAGLHHTNSVQSNGGESATYFEGAVEAQFLARSINTGATIDETGFGVFQIFNADQTTNRKSVTWQSKRGAFGAINYQGVYTGTSAIDQIDLIRSSTQTITGTIRLYGIS